ncbi:MAG TPA: hypothetical protein VJ850_12290 [Candidatus Limnocylindrales bacterium]|nr:hypothetical protein [Candidatus Limnocylindrales bacterium]
MRLLPRAIAALAGVALAIAAAACGQAPAATGPLQGCGADKADAISIGGFPDLEALIPRSLKGVAPDVVNSGRNCSDKALGSLTSHGVHELRFAGGTWNQGRADATVIAVLAPAPNDAAPQQAWIEEFYTAGAVAGTKTDNVTTTRPTIDPVGQVFRIDALNDLSLQTVVTWNQNGLIHVVIVVSEVGPTASRADHDQRVLDALAIANVPVSIVSAVPAAS